MHVHMRVRTRTPTHPPTSTPTSKELGPRQTPILPEEGGQESRPRPEGMRPTPGSSPSQLATNPGTAQEHGRLAGPHPTAWC